MLPSLFGVVKKNINSTLFHISYRNGAIQVNPLRKSWGWGGFSTFQRWRSRVFLIGPQIFDVHLLENTNFSPFSFHFSVGFYIMIMFWVRWFYSLFEWMRLKRKRTMFIHTNQPLITSFYIKKHFFLLNRRWVTADWQFFAQRAREGVKRSGAWGLK